MEDIAGLFISILLVFLIAWVLDYLSARFLPLTFHTVFRVIIFVFALVYLLQLLAGFNGIKIGTL